jgi:hypothetical protein
MGRFYAQGEDDLVPQEVQDEVDFGYSFASSVFEEQCQDQDCSAREAYAPQLVEKVWR